MTDNPADISDQTPVTDTPADISDQTPDEPEDWVEGDDLPVVQVRELFIDNKKIPLQSTDISTGCIHTQDYGSIPILFTGNLFGGSAPVLIMTPKQIESLENP